MSVDRWSPPAGTAWLHLTRALVSFALLATFVVGPHSTGAETPPVAEQLDALFAPCGQSDEPGGLAAGVLVDGKVVFRRGYGFANTEHRAPFTASTRVDFASVAKQFAGFAIATLVVQGELSLDDDVRQYLPELPDFGTPITVRHLVYHTSGLRDWVGLVKLSGRGEDARIDPAFLRRLAAAQRELNFSPGGEHLYSNLGYFLLAEIVERVAGVPFSEWMHEKVFRPLAMHDSFFVDDPDALIPNKAYPYAVREGGVAAALRNGLVSPGSSSLISTVDDMLKWVANFETHTVGSDAVFELMLTPGTTNDGKTLDYGFGISLYHYRDQALYHHGGNWQGQLSQVQLFPESRFGYVFATNRDPSGCYVGEQVYDLILGSQVSANASSPSETQDTPSPAHDAALSRHVGRYARDLGHGYSIVSVTLDDEGLRYQRDGGRTLTLAADTSAPNRFSVGRSAVVFADDGALTIESPGRTPRRYVRAQPYAPSAEQLAEFLGRFASAELHTHYDVVVEDGALVLRHFQNGDVALSAQLEDYFTADVWWLESVRFDRDAIGRVVGLRITADQGHVRGLRLTKTPSPPR